MSSATSASPPSSGDPSGRGADGRRPLSVVPRRAARRSRVSTVVLGTRDVA